eukprot:194355_1
MAVVGVCGGVASGKSKLCSILKEEYNFEVVNADTIGHEILTQEDVIDDIVEAFGDQVLKLDESDQKNSDESKDNIESNKREIDRKKLGPIVFSDKKQMNKLNDIMWPRIAKQIIEITNKFKQNKQNANNVLFIEAAVLVEANWHCIGAFDEIWIVTASKDTACARLMKRNNKSKQQAIKMIEIQMENKDKISILQNAKDIKTVVVIDNDTDDINALKTTIENNVVQLKLRNKANAVQ